MKKPAQGLLNEIHAERCDNIEQQHNGVVPVVRQLKTYLWLYLSAIGNVMKFYGILFAITVSLSLLFIDAEAIRSLQELSNEQVANVLQALSFGVIFLTIFSFIGVFVLRGASIQTEKQKAQEVALNKTLQDQRVIEIVNETLYRHGLISLESK
ncbi:hypothetical protein VIBNISOn1_1480006 [Vibrio nigripulchritudo SOn1]|uniref:Uncharacterized protein n=1 Tax=Vibrio nigripulchritudo SOn1 TaxID=1238450 RepID=A0AAV2VLC4_9VIBR|nr:hypothetical protein [Vibrio nigripulchritudo]CCO45432.1 hypothetical protein VIBNISOn1_1480006 [Vibrio nigripulchritudo SOn1]